MTASRVHGQGSSLSAENAQPRPARPPLPSWRRLLPAVAAAASGSVLVAGTLFLGSALGGPVPRPSFTQAREPAWRRFQPTAPSPTTPNTAAPTSLLPRRAAGPPDVGPTRIDHTDPVVVAATALTLIWTVDSVHDDPRTGQRDAILRAAAASVLTPGYTAWLIGEPAVPAPAATWQTWTNHDAYTQVQLIRDQDDQTPSPALLHHQWTIIATPTGRDGWHAIPTINIAFLTLTRSDPHQPWLIDQITYD